MATMEERVAALEQTVASLQGQEIRNMSELSHNMMMLLGMGLTARTDINESKMTITRLEQNVFILNRGLDRVEEHIGNIEERLTTLESHSKSFEQNVSNRIDTLEQSVNSRFDAQDRNINSRLDAQDKKLDQLLLLLNALAPKQNP